MLGLMRYSRHGRECILTISVRSGTVDSVQNELSLADPLETGLFVPLPNVLPIIVLMDDINTTYGNDSCTPLLRDAR